MFEIYTLIIVMLNYALIGFHLLAGAITWVFVAPVGTQNALTRTKIVFYSCCIFYQK